MMSFDRRAWRIDDTVHPFEISIGAGDTRITTRWDERYFPMALYLIGILAIVAIVFAKGRGT